MRPLVGSCSVHKLVAQHPARKHLRALARGVVILTPWWCAAVSQGEIYNRIYLLFPSSEDDSKAYLTTKLQKVTKEGVVAALRPLGVLGLICKDQVIGEPDGAAEDDAPAVMLLDESELHDGGEYVVIFAKTPLDKQVCKQLALARTRNMHVFECLAVRAGSRRAVGAHVSLEHALEHDQDFYAFCSIEQRHAWQPQ